MLMYSDLAPWYHLLTAPGEYVEEAAHLAALVDAAGISPAETLLELGTGGGGNASHLSARFRCTLTDLSPQILAESERINPGCEHVQGDMRTMRLGREFDVVLVHDAISYMVTEGDLRAAVTTAAVHLRPGGLAILVPDVVAETYAPGIGAGGNDGEDGRGVRYLEWDHEPAPGATSYESDWAYLLRHPDGRTEVVHETHRFGLFPRATWEAVIADAGLTLVETGLEDPYAGEHVLFTAVRSAEGGVPVADVPEGVQPEGEG